MSDGKKYEIHLDNFDGPLDLLLHLIDKNKMDIYDIPSIHDPRERVLLLSCQLDADGGVSSDIRYHRRKEAD